MVGIVDGVLLVMIADDICIDELSAFVEVDNTGTGALYRNIWFWLVE